MELPTRGTGMGIGLEPLSCNEAVPINYEQTLFQALVNEGRVLNANRPQFAYNEKQLRDAAAAEVAVHGLYCNDELGDKASRKRKHMNADEKAKQNRDRNREHAKNTRLRKKAYVLKLKELVDQMNGQKDMEEKERRALGERIHDTHIIRKNAVRLMLSYRAANVRDRDKWVAVLDEGFVFTLPITPYRSFHKGDIVSSSRVIVGVDAAIADAASLALMVESVGQGTDQWKDAVKRGQSCRVTYTSSKEDMLAAGDLIMCRYVLRTEGFDSAGALSPCVQHGMLQCRFNKQNKMVAAEMMFDVMGFMQQLQRASAISPENSIVPNTIDMALQPSREARAIIKAQPPFAIMHINEPWTAISGLTQSEAEGLPLSDSLRLHSTQEEQMYALAADCSIGSAGSAILMTHSRTAQGEPALIYLKLFPLTGETDVVSHFMGVQIDLPLSSAEKDALLTHCSSSGIAHNQQMSPFQPQGSGYGVTQQGAAPSSIALDCSPTEESRAQGRSHGEMLYQYQQQQYHLHQERISEAQMQQAYYSLSVAPQDTHSSQVGGSFEDLGCSAAHSLCIPDEAPTGAPNATSSSNVSWERAREVSSSSSSLQQQQMQLLQLQQKQQKQQQAQQQQQQAQQQQQQQQQQQSLLQQQHSQQKPYIKEEYLAVQRQERSPSSSSSSSALFNQSSSNNNNNSQWGQRQPSCVSVESQVERFSEKNTNINAQKVTNSSSAFNKYDGQQQQGQQLQQQEIADYKVKINDITNGKSKVNADPDNSSSNNSNSSCDDEKGLTWYEDLSNTSSV